MNSNIISVRQMVFTAMAAAVISALGPISFNVGPVPITLATFGIYLSVCVLGPKYGTLSVLVYILLGAFGAPVFSNFSGGFQKLIGPTGGYIAGYLPCTYLAGVVIKRTGENTIACAIGCAAGTVVLYALGTAWFAVSTGTNVVRSLSLCVFPFLIGDVLKIAIVSLITPRVLVAIERPGI